MPVFWSVNKQIQTDTVFHVIICEKHGTSTRAATPWAAKIWPRRAIFGPVPVTRYRRAPGRFCRSPVAGSRFAVLASTSGGKIGSAAPRLFAPATVRQRPGCSPRQRFGSAPVVRPGCSPRYAPRLGLVTRYAVRAGR